MTAWYTHTTGVCVIKIEEYGVIKTEEYGFIKIEEYGFLIDIVLIVALISTCSLVAVTFMFLCG